MSIKKVFILLLTIVLLIAPLSVNATESSEPKFRYELTVDGKDTVEATQGELITITLNLYRTDADKSYTMYAMQDELSYDSDFFEFVPESLELYKGIEAHDIARQDKHRELYMNFVSKLRRRLAKKNIYAHLIKRHLFVLTVFMRNTQV